ncbi:MAG: hypothetical protein WAL41_26145 [Mycobacterium sp.]
MNDEDVEAGYWRTRAARAEARVAELRVKKAGLTEGVAELGGQAGGECDDDVPVPLVGFGGQRRDHVGCSD